MLLTKARLGNVGPLQVFIVHIYYIETPHFQIPPKSFIHTLLNKRTYSLQSYWILLPQCPRLALCYLVYLACLLLKNVMCQFQGKLQIFVLPAPYPLVP